MNARVFRHVVAAALRGSGYVIIILSWLWMSILTVPPLIESGKLDFLLSDQTAPQPLASPDAAGLTPIAGVLVGAITLLMLALTLVVLWRLPKMVTRTGDKAITRSADAVLPLVTHHRPLPPKRRRELSRKLVFVLQLTVIALPFAVTLLQPSPEELPAKVVITIGAGLACAGALTFTGVYALNVPPPTSRTR